MNGKVMSVFVLSVLLCMFTVCQAFNTACPDGWVAYHGSCYLFVHGKKFNFVGAENYCRQHGAHLIHIETKRENDFIKSFLDGEQHEYFWIGMSDETIEGVWQVYGTDEDAPFLDWAPGQPDPDGDCAVFDYKDGYHWHDSPCDHDVEPLCEKSGTTDQVGVEVIG